MKKKKILIVSIIAIILLVIVLWVSCAIPKQIAKVYGTIYMKSNFSEMQLKYVSIEWSKYHEDYIITFQDKNSQIYSLVIGPKYFPIRIGQGIDFVKETYINNY